VVVVMVAGAVVAVAVVGVRIAIEVAKRDAERPVAYRKGSVTTTTLHVQIIDTFYATS
jgi:hypothetical protein